ncbi:hypothetical protein KZ820_07285 [Sphingomonas sp. RRHST34]|uniref:Uncharacterized protein n=1 Tax=Sphingomonas citri TaxID=2862499 RepID=A0ABS7BLP4_9SPHN|nr:hypothetical protein [Sphingomonas citri]MBW6530536.1 hypothetical protein [Sphingomonas citri]
MTQFILFIDDVGAEFTKARVTRRDVTALYEWKAIQFVPVEVRPLEVTAEGGAGKRAAGGFLLLGPVGAAAGVLLGKGPKVVFELVLRDGTTRKGVVHQRQYPVLRRQVAAIQSYKPGQLRKQFATVVAVLLLVPLCIGLGLVGSAVLLALIIGVTAFVRHLRRSDTEVTA